MGHENLEKFQVNFPDPVIPINNEWSLSTEGFIMSRETSAHGKFGLAYDFCR